jgi:hypothetical protein
MFRRPAPNFVNMFFLKILKKQYALNPSEVFGLCRGTISCTPSMAITFWRNTYQFLNNKTRWNEEIVVFY